MGKIARVVLVITAICGFSLLVYGGYRGAKKEADDEQRIKALYEMALKGDTESQYQFSQVAPSAVELKLYGLPPNATEICRRLALDTYMRLEKTPEIMCRIGDLIHPGIGLEHESPDRTSKAMEWYRKAAQAGSADAAEMLDLHRLSGQ